MKMQLIERNTEIKDVESFIFRPETDIKWQAGQYLHYVLEHNNPDERGIDRWFTISAAPFESNIRLTTRFTAENGSSFKRALKSMVIGDSLKAYDAEGDFLMDKDFSNHILIAGGIGITPYRSMLVQIDHEIKPINAVLMYANSDEKLVFIEELEKLETKHDNFEIQKYICEKRILADDFKRYATNKFVDYYISGPRKMVIEYTKLLESLKIPKERIKTDYFPGY
ncbi:MAG: FAD-dependent oxidoreductase [Actinomycetota bacterium]